MLKKTMALAVITLYLNSVYCQAAALPDAGADAELKRVNDVGEFYKKEKELYQDKPKIDKDSVINHTPPNIEKNSQDATRITVNQIIVDPSKILTNQEIKTITDKYEGRELALADLYQAVKEINELYKNKKYITAKAMLPPQKIEDGIVKIKLVEGRFGELLVEGNKYTNNRYFSERISLHKGDLLKLDQLQKDIFYFNNTNDIGMRAELRPGKTVGTTDCVLQVQEPGQWQTTMFTDNAGRTESGLYRIGMIFSNNSVFGNRESLVISPTWSRGSKSGMVSYSLPIDNIGTRLGFSYSKNKVDIISGQYASLDIAGDSSDKGISITQPFSVSEKRKMEGYFEFHQKESGTDFSGTNLLKADAQTVTIGTNVKTTDDKGVWYSQYSITKIEANKKGNYSMKGFNRFNLSITRQQMIDNDRMLIWHFSGQLTNNNELPLSEQFSLGGMSTVKGYNEGLVSGDRGYYTGIEYNFPLKFSKKIKGLVFVDHGSTYNRYDTGIRNKESLSSAGVGVTMNCTPDIFAKIVVGVPFASTKDHDSTRIHFFMQSNIN